MNAVVVSKNTQGQTLLTLVLMIGSIIVAAAAVFIVLVIASLSATYGYRATQVAQAASMAGIEDVMVQLARDNTFSSAGYTVTSGSVAASVTVSQNSPSTGYVTAIATASVSGATRKLSALFVAATSTGRVDLVALKIIP